MNYSILIADDEPLERQALTELIEREAPGTPTLHVAATGTAALAVLEQQAIDLALLDIRMPGATGLEVAEELRDRYPSADIVFLSAFDTFGYAQQALRLGAEDYLIKPVEDGAVLRVVERCLRRLEEPGQPTERLQEASRFLEYELLDDLITGDADFHLVERGFHLLGVDPFSGSAVVVQPDLSQYPFPLETPAQRRTVVLRVLRAVVAPLRAEGLRVLIRAHPSTGYAMVVHPPHRQISALVDHGAALSATRLRVPVKHKVSAAVQGVAALAKAVLAARSQLRGPAETDHVDHELVRRESVLLGAVLAGKEERAVQAAQAIWERLRDRDPTPAAMGSALQQLVAYLVHGLRSQGMATQYHPVPAFGESEAPPHELRDAFLSVIHELVASRSTGQSPEVRKLQQWVNDHFRENVGLEDLARHLGISVSHCSREFSRLMGTPFREHLRTRRLREAERLLKTTRLTVRELAERCGFRDGNYLTRVFTTVHGVSPGQYRATQEQNLPEAQNSQR
jgi:two-component system response regulator YesN